MSLNRPICCLRTVLACRPIVCRPKNNSPKRLSPNWFFAQPSELPSRYLSVFRIFVVARLFCYVGVKKFVLAFCVSLVFLYSDFPLLMGNTNQAGKRVATARVGKCLSGTGSYSDKHYSDSSYSDMPLSMTEFYA